MKGYHTPALEQVTGSLLPITFPLTVSGYMLYKASTNLYNQN